MTDIHYYNPEKQYDSTERCAINELLNNANNLDCSIARASVAPGVCTQLHALENTIERYVILEGQGRVSIDKQDAVAVGQLDVITIPAGAAQKIANTGTEELVFLCICTPRFEARNYHNLEQTQEQNQE